MRLTADPDPPLTAGDFSALIGSLGGPVRGRRLAVAVSGGADSVALLLLADEWARASGTRVTALTVDHGLRSGSAAEADRVEQWCGGRGVDHRRLEWTGPKPGSGIQEAARDARYEMLTRWCRENDHPDLLTAHHLDDQAETILMRMCRGSGVNGLAGMPLVSVRNGVRIVRPLLRVPGTRLASLLRERKHPWIEDPTNLDSSYTRVALRGEISRLAAAGLPLASFSRVAEAFGEMRAERDRLTAELAARSVVLYPEGYAELDHGTFRTANRDIACNLLSRLLLAVGGGRYPVRRRRLERLFGTLAAGGRPFPRTLGHCLVEPVRGGFRICREPGTVRDVRSMPVRPRFRWDGRFDMSVRMDRLPPGKSFRIGALGEAGRKQTAGRARVPLPRSVHLGLPALWDGDTVVEAPHAGFRAGTGPVIEFARFRPHTPVCGPPFRLA